MKIFIKNMITKRCVMIIKSELQNLGIDFISVELGEAELTEDLSPEKNIELAKAFKKWDFELIETKKGILIEKIKGVIIDMVHNTDSLPKVNYSDHLSKTLLHDYTYLSNLFSETENITIERFIISHKVEKVKELLIYDELNISEIARRLNYSDVAHLSNQFKKVTGFTPTYYKAMKNKNRLSLDDI